jgi:hypothetical protein
MNSVLFSIGPFNAEALGSVRAGELQTCVLFALMDWRAGSTVNRITISR